MTSAVNKKPALTAARFPQQSTINSRQKLLVLGLMLHSPLLLCEKEKAYFLGLGTAIHRCYDRSL